MRFNSWRKWLDRTFGLSKTPPVRRSTLLRLEQLEERWVPAFTGTTSQVLAPTEGVAFTGVVANFTTDTPGDTFTASINWGDGTTNAGTVSLTGSSGTVTGSHTYADEFNSLPVTVTLTETGASPDTVDINDT